ncbi:hypothetical protein BB560_001131 [Smittium megazygosporum]|uniref:Aminopeptidase P N-terminal domain-containing protein n=1 Tax=Smittium megazygosporum TaxID=133381 RepID=A0A2T9ZIE3_9FUNG|nr:hypothetical protein BB560_001131 [Smittium megazygosporum]
MPLINVAKHCDNVAKYLNSPGLIFVKGAEVSIHPDSDTELRFMQDSNMVYISGVLEPGFSFLYDTVTKKSTLLAPFITPDEAVWIGEQPSLAGLKASYGVDTVVYSDKLEEIISSIAPSKIYTLSYQDCSIIKKFSDLIDTEALLSAIHEARVFKEPEEVELMQIANNISGKVHTDLMNYSWTGKNERNVYSKFVGGILDGGCEREAYTTIVAAGTHPATLHYIKNDSKINSESDLVLVDAGGSYRGYAADITRTWPAGKTFTQPAREIYQIVLDMQKAVIENAKPHVLWEDMHLLANKVAIDGLVKLGILKGNLKEITDSFVIGYFFPHGLGHFLGIDTHDAGGYPKGVERINKPGIRYLRVRRELLEGMVLTVEPGIYFVDGLIKEAKGTPEVAKFVDFDKVEYYSRIGGVRIEDNILITANGNLNLTNVPKEIQDIEAIRCSQ